MAAIASVALVAGTFGWLLIPTGAPPTPLAHGPATVAATGDPGRRGSLGVKTLTYGSGTDRLRPEYAGGATLTTNKALGRSEIRHEGGVLAAYGLFDATGVLASGRVARTVT